MTRHHTDDGERDRRHDDQWHEIAPKLGDDEQVDEDQADTVGDAHVAEGLVGHLPLAVPLDAVASIGVRRLLDEPFTQGTALFQRLTGNSAARTEHPVERRIELAGHIAKHVDDRQQILVKDRLFACLFTHFDHF